MEPMSCTAISAGNTLADLNPANNPAINPNYPALPEWNGTVGQSAVISKWCGGCYDVADDVLWLPLGGGHGDYSGNEPYRIALNVDVPAWQMVRSPSGAIGNLLTTNDGQEATGVYADGRVRSIHSYNSAVYIPGIGPAIGVLGPTAPYGQNGPQVFVQIDKNTGESTFGAEVTGQSSPISGAAVYDPVRHSVWWRGSGTESFRRYDIATNTWHAYGSTYLSAWAETSLCYLPTYDCILWINTAVSNSVRVIDCVTGTLHAPTITGSVVGTTLNGKLSPVWVDALDCCAAWDNSTSLNVVNTFSFPTGNPRSAIEIGQMTFSGSPTERTPIGTYNRFFYSEKLHGFGVINDVAQPVYFFALD